MLMAPRNVVSLKVPGPVGVAAPGPSAVVVTVITAGAVRSSSRSTRSWQGFNFRHAGQRRVRVTRMSEFSEAATRRNAVGFTGGILLNFRFAEGRSALYDGGR